MAHCAISAMPPAQVAGKGQGTGTGWEAESHVLPSTKKPGSTRRWLVSVQLSPAVHWRHVLWLVRHCSVLGGHWSHVARPPAVLACE